MRMTFLKAALMATIASAVLTSCNEGIETEKMRSKVTVEVSLNQIFKTVDLSGTPGTKATGSDHATVKDTLVKTLHIYAFNDDGTLDAMTTLSGSPMMLKSGESEVKFDLVVKNGSKDFYAIANSHNTAGFNAVKCLDDLEEMTSSLKSENTGDFFMAGKASKEVSGDTDISINLTRHISRVSLTGLKTEFTGGYSGMSLTDVKVYLINVNPTAEALTGKGGGTMLNRKKYVAADQSDFVMTDMIYASISNITSTKSTDTNYFYCYGNSDGTAKTKLVIEGKLDGTVYYYPITIIDKDAQTYKLSPNSVFSISDVVIKRPGSDDPDDDVDNSTISFTFSIVDWTYVDYDTVMF